MPAARKARQQMSLDKPTALARRLIIRRAWLQSIGRSVSLRCVAMERRGVFFSAQRCPRRRDRLDTVLGVVMGGDLVPLAALLVQEEPGPPAIGLIVHDLHAEGGGDAAAHLPR